MCAHVILGAVALVGRPEAGPLVSPQLGTSVLELSKTGEGWFQKGSGVLCVHQTAVQVTRLLGDSGWCPGRAAIWGP